MPRSEPAHVLAPVRAVLPMRTRTPNDRAPHAQVAGRRARATRETAWGLIRKHLGLRPPLAPAYAVTLVRLETTHEWMDDDNAVGALKQLRDELAAWLGVDDGDRARVRWAYDQRASRTDGVDVTVAPCAAPHVDPRRARR
jgi:hypothetical protein